MKLGHSSPSPPTIESPRTKLLCSLRIALGACLLAACGGDAASPDEVSASTPFRRIYQGVEAAEPARKLEVLATLKASGGTDGTAPWVGTAEGGVGSTELVSPSGDRVPATTLLGRDHLKYVRGAIPSAASGFNHVSIEVAVSARSLDRRAKPEEARVYLYKEGEKLMGALKAELQRHGNMQVATFSSPLLRGKTHVPDEFAVAFIGQVEFAAVASVTFARADDSTFAPPFSAKSASELPLVRIGSVSRRGFGLTPARPFKTSIVLGQGEEFRAFAGLSPSALRPGELATITLNAEGTTGTAEIKLDAVDADSWRDLTVSAAMVGEGPVELSVAIQSSADDGGAIGVLAEPSVRRVSSSKEMGGAPPPTVLLVTSDTHRADHIGVAAKDGLVSTPHIDALAARGVHFLDCAAPTNVTAPSHVSLMTGMHVRDTGILTNRDILSANAVTLAARFQAAGYETLAATSVFHLSQAKSGIGNGFDRIDAPAAGARPGVETIQIAADWIREAGDAPLFCWVHVYDAHTPYSPPAPYDQRYWEGGDPFEGEPASLGDVELPGWLRGLSDSDYPYAQYRAEVDFVDGMLGDLFNLPRVQSGITAFTADHGELFGEHGIWWSHTGLYPGIQQIPLVMSWPGAPAGTRVGAPVRLMDVGQTLASAAGIEADALPGRDLRQVMASPPPPEPRFYLGAHHYLAAIEADGWFLTLSTIRHKNAAMASANQPGEVELYHLTEDPEYKTNVVLQNLERATALRARLIQWLMAAPEERLNTGGAVGDAEADVAMLAALGYGGERSAPGAAYWDPEAHDANWSTNPWRLIFEEDDMTPERAAELLGEQE
jgi:arylsulfatase A-like enzyme